MHPVLVRYFCTLNFSKRFCLLTFASTFSQQFVNFEEAYLTLFRMGFFGAAHGWDGGLPPIPKICHAYPTMIKLGTFIPYPKKIQKIYESRDTPLEFCWHPHFFTGNQQILLYQEIQI